MSVPTFMAIYQGHCKYISVWSNQLTHQPNAAAVRATELDMEVQVYLYSTLTNHKLGYVVEYSCTRHLSKVEHIE